MERYAALALIYLALMTSCYYCSPAPRDKVVRNARVLVLGAGMSGIMATKTLHEAGITDVILIEGTDRVGGRTRQTNVGDVKLEAGSMYIHGMNNHPIYKMAQEYNVKFVENDAQQLSIRDKDGNKVEPSSLTDRFSAWGKAEETKEGIAEKLYYDKSATDISHREGLRRGGWVQTSIADYVIEWISDEGDYADKPDVRSLKYEGIDWTWEAFGDGDRICSDPNGYSTIHENLLTSIWGKDRSRLKLKETVTSIAQNATKVKVTTADGNVYTGDYVIASFSVGVLQSSLVTYEPPLPAWKRNAINQFRMNYFVPTYWKFPHAFWEDVDALAYIAHRKGYYPLIINMNKYRPGSNTLRIVGVGSEGLRMARLSRAELKNEVMGVLRKFYSNVPEPTHYAVVNWPDDIHFRGSYSGWPVGYSLESHSALRAPVGRLHFTGEHTGSRFRSTVHAAYFAGKCQAKRLLRCLKDGQCDPYQPGTVTSICDEELNPGSSAATAKRKTWLWAVIMAVTSLSVIS